MKTGEMYTYVLANPKAEFKSVGEKLGDFTARFNEVGKLIDKHGDLVFPRCDMDWELVPREVTWQEAIGAWLEGEAVVCKYKGGEAIFLSGGINMALYADKEKFKYGKWYIKPMTCPLIKG